MIRNFFCPFSLKKLLLKILWIEVRKGGSQFLWKMVLWGATFNAVGVVGVVSLLLFRLPMAILWNPVKKLGLCTKLSFGPLPANFNDVIYGRPFGRGEGLECMQTAWYVLDIKMSDSLFPSSLSTPHCSAGVNRGISNSLGRNSCFITETVGGTVYRLDSRGLLFKICIHLIPDLRTF